MGNEFAKRLIVRTILILGLAVGGTGLGVAKPDEAADSGSALKVLVGYCGRDVRDLDEAESKPLVRAIEALVPGRHYTAPYFSFYPWYVWRFSKPGVGQTYVVFDVQSGMPSPGSTPIQITALSSQGSFLFENTFTTGARCFAGGAELKSAGAGQFPIIAVDTKQWATVVRQYYAWIGNRIDLIRLEYGSGKATRNSYDYVSSTCGPTVPSQTEAEWETDLCGSDRFKVLRALVWLGGVHRTIKPKETPEPNEEKASEIELAERVRQRPKVIARLKELARSADKWEREEAALALDPVASRW
jgi:hypothetical protein